MDENCVNRNNEQETTSKRETWSRGANSRFRLTST